MPKQFWSPPGQPALLETTLDRVAPLTPPTRTVVVVADAHEPFVRGLPGVSGRYPVRYQPSDRGTAAGVLLGLLAASGGAADPLVLLTPSDHGIADPVRFRHSVQRAAGRVAAGQAPIVLFGSRPTSDDGDYGWIVPGAGQARGAFRPVSAFLEKPPAAVARHLKASHAVWNTMVMVARSSLLWALSRAHVPDVTSAFEEARRLGEPDGSQFLSRVYHSLPIRDFSRDVLGRAQGLVFATWPSALGWCDLGTPERLVGWQRQWSAGGRRRPAVASVDAA